MVAQIKKWLEPPCFPGDEEKSARARTINTVQFYFMTVLVFLALVLVPLLIRRKEEAYAIILVLLVLNLISRSILFRGRLEFACILMISVAWAVFVGIASLSGGISSPLIIAIVATAISASLLIKPPTGVLFVVLSALAGLALALLEQGGMAFPQAFSYSPLAAWGLFGLTLLFVYALMNLVLNNLKKALASEWKQNEARRQAEQALRQSEERFQMFMRHFPGLAYMKDSSGQILFVNQGFHTYLGLNPLEMIGRTSQEFFGPEFGGKLDRDDRRILELGISQDIQEEFGGRTWMTHKFCIDQPGASPLLGGVTLDITDRVQAGEALRESEERLRQILENSQDVPYRRNLQTGRYDYMSPSMLQASGYSAQEWLDMPVETVLAKMDGEDLPAAEEAIRASTADPGRPFQIEYRFRHKDGQCRWFQDRFTTQLDEKGRAIFRYGTLRDITESKQAAEALQASEARFRVLIEQASMAICLSRGGLGLYANQELLKLFRFSSRDEARGRAIADYFAPRYRLEILERTRRRSLGLPVSSNFEAYCVRADGSEFPALVNVAPVQLADGPALLAFVTDNTERKRSEEKIRAALEEKETLLREVHHRVKNNLQVIIALIRMKSASIPDNGTRQFLKELEAQAHTMALVYEQLYQSENLAQIQMGPYLHQLTSNVLDTFGHKEVIQLDLDAPLLLDVAQAMPCGLIVNELFTNILKHAFPPGFSGTPAVKIAIRQDGETCHLSVSDNGVGLPQGTDWRSGQTLGLQLVNLWVTHQLGGTLAVTSETGTTFCIVFGLDK